jgi:hypothetical protein
LAAKWADVADKKLIKWYRNNVLSGNEKRDSYKLFRKLVVAARNVIETKMCKSQWNEINYEHVPSVAMSRYTKAFKKRDESRFTSYKESLVKGEVKINASALFPHDCVRTALNGDPDIANAQFNSLPNYMAETNERVLSLCDSSGSMSTIVSGSVQAVHISTGLSLYCSDKVRPDNPFYRKFLQFESEATLTDWSGMSLSQALGSDPTRGNRYGANGIFNGACGATNVEKALDTILHFAKLNNATNDQIPTMLLIVSDMQFNQATQTRLPTVEACMQKWEASGYNRPKIVYWNVSPHAGQPATIHEKNVAMISGFSPAVLMSVLTGKDITPVDVMMKTANRYTINPPTETTLNDLLSNESSKPVSTNSATLNPSISSEDTWAKAFKR